MADNDYQSAADETVEVDDELAGPEFDRMFGIITDGIVGAIGGLAGTIALTCGLFVASTLGAFDFASFAVLIESTGLDALLGVSAQGLGFVVFLGVGMTVWPLLLASIGAYLPGDRYAIRGIPLGIVLWTGFVGAFYDGYAGVAFVLYVVLTLLAHISYGFVLGAVFDYFSERPDTLV